MTIKITGYEFKKFMNDDKYWKERSEHTYYDDAEITINDKYYNDYIDGIDSIDDKDIVRIHSGIVYFDEHSDISLITFFKKWRKIQSTSYFMIECDNYKKEKIVASIKSLGGKIIK